MPESAEVRYISSYINERFSNKKLKQMTILQGRYVNHAPPDNLNSFIEQFPIRLIEVRVKGKVLFFYFENGWCLISKLGLMGWWYADDDEPTWRKSIPCVVFSFGDHKLYYSDNIGYGTITLTNDTDRIDKEINKLAPDIIDVNYSDIKDRISKIKKNKKIEDVLVDQKAIVSGIGNYIKAEVLYSCKISPLRTVGHITDREWTCIINKSKKIINRQMEAMESPDDYMDQMLVYQKKTDRLGNPVKIHKTKTGRTTHWVPNVQI